MSMKKAGRLLAQISQDPKVLSAIALIQKKSQKEPTSFDLGKQLLFHMLRVSAKLVGKRGLRLFTAIQTLILIYEVSMIINENLLQRPEVKAFFKKHTIRVYDEAKKLRVITNKFIDLRLRKKRNTSR